MCHKVRKGGVGFNHNSVRRDDRGEAGCGLDTLIQSKLVSFSHLGGGSGSLRMPAQTYTPLAGKRKRVCVSRSTPSPHGLGLENVWLTWSLSLKEGCVNLWMLRRQVGWQVFIISDRSTESNRLMVLYMSAETIFKFQPYWFSLS